MGFKVHNASGYESYPDDATYDFNQAGLLVIKLGGSGGSLTYSPHAWTVVEEPDREGGYHLQRATYSRE